MNDAGYYRFPTIWNERIIFVCEDDLWTVSADGGEARRLTANLGEVTHPVLSPDGEHVAFTGREEGQPEVYIMPAGGGPARRLTFQGAAMSQVAAWTPDGAKVLFASSAGQPFAKLMKLFSVDRAGGLPQLQPFGPANNIAFGPHGRVVLGRHTRDPARWKRYRGGTCGYLWIDATGDGQFRRLLELDGNLASPMWVGDRIYFLSDHEGIGNLYSCAPTGDDVQRHTDHQQFYARNACSDGKRVVYHAGAELYLYDPSSDRDGRVPVRLLSTRTQRNRKFVGAAKYLESARLHPKGHSVAVTTRGKPFSVGNWEGPVVQHGEPGGVRYRLGSWLADGKRLVAVGDEGGEEALVIFHADGSQPPKRLPRLDIGRAMELALSPTRDCVALHNHRAELILVDLTEPHAKVADASRHGPIMGIAWSPDGRWVAYSFFDSPQTSIIKLYDVESGQSYAVTEPVLQDSSPSFDPQGKYLYFLSRRVFDPVYDNVHFDLNFPRGMRPHLVTLRKDLPSPFRPRPGEDEPSAETKEETGQAPPPSSTGQDSVAEPVKIDLEGIQKRLVAFPVPEGKYGQIRGLPNGKVLFTSSPVEGSLKRNWTDVTPKANGTLQLFDLAKQKEETWAEEVGSFDVSADGKKLIYRSGDRLRVIPVKEKPKAESAKEPPGRESGWIDLARLKVSVHPPDEWRQMYRETWRLQRDHFWVENMSGVDWESVYNRYAPLLERVASRSEFSDLIWEMQGELGTSHAYEIGGDYRKPPRYQQGFLGADFQYDAARGGYTITNIIQGDAWEDDKASPLCNPGVNLEPGDRLLAIGGRALTAHVTPNELLVNQAGGEVILTVARGDNASRTVSVKVLKDEAPARYRAWVERNRNYVHQATSGHAGYVHIPDMGPGGYAEFHRYWLAEVQHDAMIIDVRFNGGGHVSELILEKLLRRRVGYWFRRWGEPIPYPECSVAGPLVAITNELAGSDGDQFSHCFKLYKLGLLIGKRTWGGLIGISPRHPLVDGSLTTQPEFSSWLVDVGWGVENYGTDPDIDVDITPHDDAREKDPQLDRAIAEVLRLLETNPPLVPSFDAKPDLSLPKLPPRGA